jgi:2-iminobutanoate/2-iminopropanoate deaminase
MWPATTPEGTFIDGPIEDQANQVMKNLQAILEEAGSTFADVVKTTIYLIDMADYGKMNEVYTKYMTAPYPARETVVVTELPRKARVEISMIAMKS